MEGIDKFINDYTSNKPINKNSVITQKYVKTESLISNSGIKIYSNSNNTAFFPTDDVPFGTTGPILQMYGRGGKGSTIGINLDTFQSDINIPNGRNNNTNPGISIIAIDNGNYSADLVFSTAPQSLSINNLSSTKERLRIKSDGNINILNSLNVNSNLNVNNISCNENILSENLIINKDLMVNESSYLKNVTIKNKTTTTDLTVQGNTIFENIVISKKDLSIQSNLFVNESGLISQIYTSIIYFPDGTFINTGTNSYSLTGIMGETGSTGYYNDNLVLGGNLEVSGTITAGSTGYYKGLLVGSTGLQCNDSFSIITDRNIQVAGVTITSDYRIKENIKKLDNTFNVDNIEPYIYDNLKSNNKEIGFIAHEIKEVYPYLVSGEKDGNVYQSINYNSIIGILVKEIKDLKKEVNILKNNLTL